MKRLPAFSGILLILVIGAGLLLFQRQHIKKHLPLIPVALNAAEEEGPVLLQRIGTPATTVPYEQGLKYFPQAEKGAWRGTKTRVAWRQEWETPDTYESVEGWFAEALDREGWTLHEPGVPSVLEKMYLKDKWLLTLQRGADFSTASAPKVRHVVVMEWDYWRNL